MKGNSTNEVIGYLFMVICPYSCSGSAIQLQFPKVLFNERKIRIGQNCLSGLLTVDDMFLQ